MACKGSFHQFIYEEAPCDTCPLWDLCKSKELACPTFATWALSGRAANKFGLSLGRKEFIDKPTHPIYRLIYCGEDDPPKAMIQDATGSVEIMGESK